MNQIDNKYLSLVGYLTPGSLRARLLLSVNTVLFVLLAVLLGYDYQREMTVRLRQRQAAIQEEAESLLQACRVTGQQGTKATQHFIDDVCATAHDKQSPGHHIVVEIAGSVLQAKSHGRQSTEMLDQIRETINARSGQVPLDARMVAGTAGQEDLRVYVAESVSDIQQVVRREILTHSGALLIGALVAGVVVNFAIGHLVTRPIRRLVTVVNRIGQGELGIQGRSFGSDEVNFLADEINRMSRNLAELDRNRRAQMAKAQSIQKDLLPGDVHIPNVRYFCLFEPADEVGGDFYDIVQLSNGSWLFCLADVSGHGVPAAMTAAIVKSLLTEAARQFTSPAEIFKHINRGLLEISPNGNFVTMALMRVDPHAGSLVYASAGHEPTWLLPHNGQVRELSSTGLILGVDANATWNNVTVDLTAKDRLLMVTDGVSETHDHEGKMFGRDRLASVVAESKSMPVAQSVGSIHEALQAFRNGTPQMDDVTVVLVELDRDAYCRKGEQLQ